MQQVTGGEAKCCPDKERRGEHSTYCSGADAEGRCSHPKNKQAGYGWKHWFTTQSFKQGHIPIAPHCRLQKT